MMKKNEMSYRGYSGSAEVSCEDECLHGRILFIDDLITYEAEGYAGLREEFERAVDDYLAYCESRGKQPDKPYSGTFNVRLGPGLHKRLVQYAVRSDLKLNQVVVQACELFLDRPAERGVVNNHYHLHAPQHDPVRAAVHETIQFWQADQEWTQALQAIPQARPRLRRVQ